MVFECDKAWIDRCNHPPESYVGSFECLGEKHDLYVYDCPSLGKSVCIRHGNDDPDYSSPGNLVMFIRCAHILHHYQDALEMLQTKGVFDWHRKPI